jgi:hypothetical protein
MQPPPMPDKDEGGGPPAQFDVYLLTWTKPS